MKIEFYGEDIRGGEKFGTIHCPYFYLHGELEERNGFDLVSIHPESFPYLLQRGIRYCEVIINGNEFPAVLFVSWNGTHRMCGLICDIRNKEDLTDAIEKMYLFDGVTAGSPAEDFNKAGYSESLQFINSHCHNRIMQGAKRRTNIML